MGRWGVRNLTFATISERRRDHPHADQDGLQVRSQLDGDEVFQGLERAIAVQGATVVELDTRPRFAEALVFAIAAFRPQGRFSQLSARSGLYVERRKPSRQVQSIGRLVPANGFWRAP
jgi:hypothetical protein